MCVWLTLVDVWQKPAQYYKASIFQLKINELIKKQNPAPLLTSSLASILFNLGLRSCLCKRGGGVYSVGKAPVSSLGQGGDSK